MMKYTLLLLLFIATVTVVETGKKKKGGKGGGCSPKKITKSAAQYEKCVRSGYHSTLGCKWVEPLKPLKTKQMKKCTKIEKLANKCGYKCPVDGGWSMFGNWTECTAECAGGSQTRYRTCDNPVPEYGGAECEGEMEQSQECNTFPCPVNGGWSEYGAWSDCSEECGGGTQQRTRNCNNPAPDWGGAECVGESTISQECNIFNCPVDGHWSEYGEWSECSASCGGGKQFRVRSCNNPAPEYGGNICQGNFSQTIQCNTQPCKVDGNWSPFGDWSECTVECGGGSQTRQRACDMPAPAHGGAECVGEEAESQECNMDPCPVDGNWSQFGEWSDCSVECGGGNRTRLRSCDSPAPEHGGLYCKGANYVTQACNTLECPVQYEFTHKTSNRGKWDGGAFSGYFYTVIGTTGETAEHDCEADRERGGTGSCTIEDYSDIGRIKGLRIRNSGDNTWRFVKIDVKINGAEGGSFEGYTSVDDYATVTVPILNDKVNPDCGRKSLGCWADNPSRAIEGGIRFHSDNPVEDCERYAHERGFNVFAVEYDRECFTARNAEETYQSYGRSADCGEDGRGGLWAMSVYTTDQCKPKYDCGRQSLGCWKDNVNRAIQGGVRFSSQNPVKDCEAFALEKGFSIFGVEFGTMCFTAENAESTYQMYGPSGDCKDGRGGPLAQSVYKTGSCPETPECARKSLGCWKDDPLRAIRGGVRLTSNNPVEECEKFAIKRGFPVFAVQRGKECFTSRDATMTYQMYGPSSSCRDGKGGTWAQNVYKAGTC